MTTMQKQLTINMQYHSSHRGLGAALNKKNKKLFHNPKTNH